MGVRAVVVLVALAIACRQSAERSAAPPSVAYTQHLVAGGALPPAGLLENPLKNDAAAAQAGEQLFSAMNCDGCHGGGALGWVGPSLVDGRWRYGGADGEVFHSIFYGRPRGMPAYGGILPNDAVWKIISYLRAQPVPKDVPTQSWIR